MNQSPLAVPSPVPIAGIIALDFPGFAEPFAPETSQRSSVCRESEGGLVTGGRCPFWQILRPSLPQTDVELTCRSIALRATASFSQVIPPSGKRRFSTASRALAPASRAPPRHTDIIYDFFCDAWVSLSQNGLRPSYVRTPDCTNPLHFRCLTILATFVCG